MKPNRMLKNLIILTFGLGMILSFSAFDNAQATEVKVNSAIVDVGDEFNIDITVDVVTNLYGVAFDLVYDPAKIEVVDADGQVANGIQPKITEGQFLNEGGLSPTILRSALQDNILGRLVLGLVREGQIGGIDTVVNQTILSITFKALVEGSSWITFENATLRDPDKSDIQVDEWISGFGGTESLPMVRNIETAGASANIGIIYELLDLAGGPCDITVEYKLAYGADIWHPASVLGATLNIMPGQNKEIIWDSLADLPEASNSYIIRITPQKGADVGLGAESEEIYIRNSSTRISGAVYASDGVTPLANILVEASGYSSVTDFNGQYTVAGVYAGQNYVRVNPHSYNQRHGTNYISEWYNNAATWDGAWPINVAEGQTVSNINFILEEGNSISGTVLRDFDGATISGIQVYVENTVTDEYLYTQTKNDGTYTILGLRPGQYIVAVDPYSTNYVPEYYDNVTNPDNATPVTVVAGQNRTSIDFSLAEYGSLSGRVVKDSDSLPIQGIYVYATSLTNPDDWWHSAYTNEYGEYTITSLVADSYRVWVQDGSGIYLAEYYDNVQDPNFATPVSVASGQDTPNINFSLAEISTLPRGTISGRVIRDFDGQPIENIPVSASRSGIQYHYRNTTTQTDGTFTIPDLIPGDYIVRAEPDYQSPYMGEYYNNTTDYGSATLVPVTAGQDTGGIDFSLAEKGSISGRVTREADGQPISGLYIYVGGVYSYSAQTQADGTYTVIGVMPGNYIVQVDTYATNYIPEYYNNVSNYSEATPVTVIAGQDTAGINFALTEYGSISGTIVRDIDGQPIAGVWVDVMVYETGHWVAGSPPTDANGFYKVEGLAPGSYRVRVNISDTDYATEYYNNAPTYNRATPVEVVSGIETLNINFSLAQGGSISGIIRDTGGNPIAGLWVDVFDYNSGSYIIGSPPSGANGAYFIQGLAQGSYKVKVETSGTNYIREYYNNVIDPNQAIPVNVVAAQDTSGIDFELTVGGSISGTVTAEVGGTPIEGLWVTAHDYNTNVWLNNTRTQPNGTYQIRGLPSGSYRVDIDTRGTYYAHEFYDNTYDWDAATPVNVTVGQDTLNIDFALAEGGRIKGTVTVEAGGLPIPGIWVDAQDYYTNQWLGNGQTQADGTYTTSGLPAGTYKVSVNTQGTNYAREFYDNTYDWDVATAVPVTVGQDTADIDFALAEGGSISGIVTRASVGTPMENIEVMAFWYDSDSWMGGARTKSDGSYNITGLGYGDYRVMAGWGTPSTIPEFYNEKSDWDDADRVTVSEALSPQDINFTLQTYVPGSISGFVLDTEGVAIANVEVEYEHIDYDIEREVLTDSEGHFTINDVPPGIGEIYAMPEVNTGFVWSLPWPSSLVYLEEGENKENYFMVLQQGALVSGYVKDTSGQPLVNFDEIECTGKTFEVWVEPDENGYYQMRLPVGAHKIYLDADDEGPYRGYAALPQEVTVTDISQPVSAPDIIAYSPGDGQTISGDVNNPSGFTKSGDFEVVAFVAGTMIDTQTIYGIVPVSETELDAASPFTIGSLPPTVNYDLYLIVFDESTELDSLIVLDYELNLPGGSTGLSLDYTYEGSTVTGTISDGTRGILGAQVLFTEETSGRLAGFAVTDQNGDYHIYNMQPGTYKVEAVHSKYTENFTTITTSDGVAATVPTITLQYVGIPGLGSISGTIVNESASPVAAVELGYEHMVIDIERFTTSASDGKFTLIDLPTGIAPVYAKPDISTGLAWSIPEPCNYIYLESGENKTGHTIVVKPGAPVLGYIRDPLGNPLADFDFDFAGKSCGGWGETDENGYYQIRLPLGNYTINLDMYDEETPFAALSKNITVENVSQPITLPDIVAYSTTDGASISGSVNNPSGYPKEGIFGVAALEAGTMPNIDNIYGFEPTAAVALMTEGPFVIVALPPTVNYDIYLVIVNELNGLESVVVRASQLAVSGGTTGVNLYYNFEGNQVSGAVSDGVKGVLGAFVTFTELASGDFVAQTETDQNGHYTIYNVPSGTYKVETTHSLYNTNGQTEVTVVNGLVTTVPSIILINDLEPPVAEAGPDQSVNEDTAVHFDGSGSTDNVGIASYIWNFDDGSTEEQGVVVEHIYPQPGVYIATLTVDDAIGNGPTSDTLQVTVLDITLPIANAGPDQTVDEDTVVNFNGSGSTDNVGIISYNWAFGDGNSDTGVTVTHTYPNPGLYTVTLTCIDAAGNPGIDTCQVMVRDITPPTIIIDPVSTPTNQDVTLTYQVTDNYSLPENISVTADQSPYTQEGDYNVTLRATDEAGNWSEDSVSFTIDKTPPVIAITDPANNSGVAETLIDVSGTIDDPSATIEIEVTGQTTNYFAATNNGDGTFSATGVTIEGTGQRNIVKAIATDPATNRGEDTISIFQAWVLHINLPNYYPKELLPEPYNFSSSGAATARMIIDLMRPGDDTPSQLEIYEYGHPYNEVFIDEMDPQAMDYVLGHFDSYDPSDPQGQGHAYYGYNFDIDVYEADQFNEYLRDILHWMAYPVTQGYWWNYQSETDLVEEPNTPAAVPVYSTYEHWLVINGSACDKNPYASEPHRRWNGPWDVTDFTVYGLWLTDPAGEGLGQDNYFTASECQVTALLPLNSPDSYNGKYLQVAEPPAYLSDAYVSVAEPRINKSTQELVKIADYLSGKTDPIEKHLLDKALVVNLDEEQELIGYNIEADLLNIFKPTEQNTAQINWKEIIDSSLLTDKEFTQAIQGSMARSFIPVKRLDKPDKDYYLIPFDKFFRGQFLSYAAIIIDKSQGYFKQASWVDVPVRFIQITEDEAIEKILAQTEIEDPDEIQAELVWSPSLSSSPFYPVWRIIVKQETYYINQQGEIVRHE